MPPRSDAVENRAGLIEAARRVFSAHGVSASLDLVIREAGVGRGTLYRHFPDREALVAAILDDRITDLEDMVQSMPADRQLERLLARYCSHLLDTPGLVGLMRTSPGGPAHFERMQSRLSSLLEGVIRTAKHEGEARPSLSVADVILGLAMMEGALANLGPVPDRHVARRAVELLVLCFGAPETASDPSTDNGQGRRAAIVRRA